MMFSTVTVPSWRKRHSLLAHIFFNLSNRYISAATKSCRHYYTVGI
jgi:hypothetical protein